MTTPNSQCTVTFPVRTSQEAADLIMAVASWMNRPVEGVRIRFKNGEEASFQSVGVPATCPNPPEK